jgi:hypothetical protein
MCEAQWGIAFHTNSHSPRAKKWYRVTRVIQADGKWFELYWHPDIALRSQSRKKIREAALDAGLDLLHGVFHDPPSPRVGNELQYMPRFLSAEDMQNMQAEAQDKRKRRESNRMPPRP